ncbi:MAG: hypothetical protein IAA31_02300 [Candidatus Anaerobiospirillum merdipullorum]|uniref:Tetratricopeptide repeat protein n=1 Tax=Candidatus Anaerobiospirillum merdipullorum TaxID=2838450 RepID=A0A9E2NRV9_9GAMM|nr:hypothetical protein [Candidatus Anaerobiospirillum merdipullorum]
MYFAAICLLKQGKRDEAISALESIELMGREGEPNDQVYKNKAAELLKVIKADQEA